MNTDTLYYAGFWKRLGANLLDLLVQLPIMAFCFWGMSNYRLFQVYWFLPNILFDLFYDVYLVRRYGGTPGKLLMGIRICKVNGEPVGYREAFLRELPRTLLGIMTAVGPMLALLLLSDAEYQHLDVEGRSKRIDELTPFWQTPFQWIQSAWIWSELIVLLTNKKRRALHDFIAGTVVVFAPRKFTPPEVPDSAVTMQNPS